MRRPLIFYDQWTLFCFIILTFWTQNNIMIALEANKKRYEAYKLEQKALEIMDKEVIYAK